MLLALVVACTRSTTRALTPARVLQAPARRISTTRPAAVAATALPLDTTTTTTGVYSEAALYDAAFSYRDYEEEVDFLLEAHARHGPAGTRPLRVLELGAGPARHCMVAARDHGVTAYVLDRSADMVSYATELSLRNEVAVKCELGDMTDADAVRRAVGDLEVDAAWCLLGSAAHLLTARDFVAFLRAVGAVLVERGTLTVELPHPKEVFRLVEATESGWDAALPEEMEDVDGVMGVTWGTDDDPFDPITQIRTATVTLTLADRVVSDTLQIREFTCQELVAYALASGVFDCDVVFYGAMDERFLPIDDEEEAFRLVAIFTKIV